MNRTQHDLGHHRLHSGDRPGGQDVAGEADDGELHARSDHRRPEHRLLRLRARGRRRAPSRREASPHEEEAHRVERDELEACGGDEGRGQRRAAGGVEQSQPHRVRAPQRARAQQAQPRLRQRADRRPRRRRRRRHQALDVAGPRRVRARPRDDPGARVPRHRRSAAAAAKAGADLQHIGCRPHGLQIRVPRVVTPAVLTRAQAEREQQRVPYGRRPSARAATSSNKHRRRLELHQARDGRRQHGVRQLL
eukprot:3533566-Prymnesium_polylepis.1